MTSTNLTRAGAADRMTVLEASRYDIPLDLTTIPVDAPHSAPTFAFKTTISLTAKRIDSAFIDLRDAIVKSVAIDGIDTTEAARYTSETGTNLDLTEDDHTVVANADCRYTSSGRGIHRFQDPTDDETYLYPQFGTADAKHVFTCFDQPDLKATCSIYIIALKGWKAIPNSTTKTGTTTDAHGNAAGTFDFSVDIPLSTYLVAAYAGL